MSADGRNDERDAASGGRLRVVFVTDPLCSWCWGMADAIEHVRSRLTGFVEFDFWVGGLNLSAKTPLAAEALPRFQDLWTRVAATTGARYSMRLPDNFVYNSRPACRAIEAARRSWRGAPFAYLHALQRAFFVDARDTTLRAVATEVAGEVGCDVAAFSEAYAAVDDATLDAEFKAAKAYGTNALPSLLGEIDGKRALLAGGYLDAETLEATIRGWRERVFKQLGDVAN